MLTRWNLVLWERSDNETMTMMTSQRYRHLNSHDNKVVGEAWTTPRVVIMPIPNLPYWRKVAFEIENKNHGIDLGDQTLCNGLSAAARSKTYHDIYHCLFIVSWALRKNFIEIRIKQHNFIQDMSKKYLKMPSDHNVSSTPNCALLIDLDTGAHYKDMR